MLRKIWSLARLVLIDGLRRNALIGLVLLAFGLEAGGLLFMDFIPRDIGRASADFILSVGWLTGFLFLLFHAVQVMAWDEERRTIHTLLARPISRTQYVLGTFLGLAILLVLLNVILGVLGYGVLALIKGSIKLTYFAHLSPIHYLFSWAGLLCMELMILAIIMLFSGLVRGGFPVLLLTVSYYFICTGLPVVREAVSDRPDLTSTSLPILLQWLTALFPDFSRFDFKALITSEAAANSFQGFATDLGMLVLYLTVALWAAALVYQRRDLQ
ncbi:ABC transporter permease [Desulfobulbus elongatus]|uniref:ABC transporter permease n=1 Tax=Desulfobulbus elongatus TaxID=53332 RepID=UPI0004891BF3|nr:ABC transporter permease subunit [Desulfobulbus elongatus]